MYQPVEFQSNEPLWALEHVRRNPFGILFGAEGDEFSAAHLPFLVADASGTPRLEGHGAIRNSFLTGLSDGTPVLAVFTGASAYISPGVYTAEPDVPTWNYSAVHVRGLFWRLPVSANADILERTVRANEDGPLGTGWSTNTMSTEDLRSMARGVVSFAIDITAIEGGKKLSQDKLQEDVTAVESHLACAHVGEARDVGIEMQRAEVAGRTGPPSTDPASWLGPLEAGTPS